MIYLEEFDQMCEMRSQIYRMIGSLFFTELKPEQIERLSQQDYRSFADLDPEMAQGAKEMERALRHAHPGLREDLAVDYAHTFLAAGSTKDEARAMPFESIYTSETGLLMGPARQSVYKIMLKEGVLPDESLHVPEDHLSFECEFMAVLSEKSLAASRAGNVSEARRCVEVQEDFRANHLANWIGDLYQAVDRTCRTRFYRGVTMMTKAFVRIDKDLLEECMMLLDGAVSGRENESV